MTYLTRAALVQTTSPMPHQLRPTKAPRFGVSGASAAASAAHAFAMRQAEERQHRQEMQQAVLAQAYGQQTGQDIYTQLVDLQQQSLEAAYTRMQEVYQQNLSVYKADQARISQLPLYKRPFQHRVPKPQEPSLPSTVDNPIRLESFFSAYQADQHEALQEALRAFIEAHLLAATEDSIQLKQGAAVIYGLA